MPDTAEETAWRAEFEADGERQVHDTAMFNDTASYPPPKRLFALQWLRDQEKARKDQEEETRRHVRWTFWAAVAAVAVGIVGILVTWWLAH
jgi:hypothetical protein